MQARKQRKIPVKILRYFSIIPWLQKMFLSAEVSRRMIWHATDRVEDDKLRYPADTEVWKHIDRIYPDFGREGINLRLGLASDGFNLSGVTSSSSLMRPVLLTPYNLPPGMCMKAPYVIMALWIRGKHLHGNDIDLFLEPLIDDLNAFWTRGILDTRHHYI